MLSPAMSQIVSNAGAEFALYDMEHTGLGFETLKTQFASCRGLGIVPMARVPRGEYHFIARALDIGALGVMVPMVANRAEAEFHVSCAALSAARPQGRRVRLCARRLSRRQTSPAKMAARIPAP